MDYRLRLDGALDELWEPMWRLSVRLFPEEKALLQSKTMRRLHYIRHGGASLMNSHHTYSRLQHTLGVFALAAHFESENQTLRMAALLHDSGHAPFSHTFDSIEGVDHHLWTQEAVYSEEVGSILSRVDIDPAQVMAYIHGTQRSLLRNREQTLHADHLDSWVRSAFVGGYLQISPSELLAEMSYRNGNLEFTPEAGRLVTGLIWEEARMHGSPANIGINAMLRKLALRLIVHGELDVRALPAMTDAHIEQLLRSGTSTSEEYERLLMESWRINVARKKPDGSAEVAVLRKLYLALPLIAGVPISETSFDIRADIQELEQMLGTYYVWWSTDR